MRALRPFRLTDKGTVREKVTLQLYKEKIDEAYEKLETQQKDEVSFPTTFDERSVAGFLQDVLRTMLPDKELTSNADLFEYGKECSTRLKI